MNDAQKAEYYEQEVNALFDTIAISVLPERRTCCDVFPEGYKDITPQEGPDGPDYLKVLRLLLVIDCDLSTPWLYLSFCALHTGNSHSLLSLIGTGL